MNHYEKIIQEKRNDRYTTLKSIRTETYKGCEINISESQSPYEDRPVYVYSAHDRQMKIFVKGTAGSEAEALTKAKREIDIKANSKEENYYAKLAEEKKQKQNGPDEDNKILEKIAPVLVRKYKRSQAPALTPKEVAILLEERNRFPSTLAQQAVQMWYDHV